MRESAQQMTKAASAQQSEELSELKHQLEETQQAKEEALALCEALKQDADSVARTLAELRDRKEAMEKANAADDNASLGPPIDERRRESYGSDTSKSRRSIADPEKELRDQIKGLKHMIQELQKENAGLTSQKKMLETDNKILSSEAEELKEEIKTLEDAVERTILQEEQALAQESGTPSNSGDASSITEIKAKHAAELRQLNDKLKEKESTIRNLNKEMADYESLIESKIYEEDDYTRKIATLEGQVKQLKDRLSRGHSSRSGDSSHSARSSAAPTISEEATCDLCGGRDHDFTTCPQLNGGAKHSAPTSHVSVTGMYCDDCESFGHNTANCPHSQDVF